MKRHARSTSGGGAGAKDTGTGAGHTSLHQAQAHELLRSWQSQRNDISNPCDFVLPIFVGNDDNAREPVESMPGVFRYGCNTALEFLEPLVARHGLRSVLLFPVITKTDVANDEDESSSDEEEDDDDDQGEEQEQGKDAPGKSQGRDSRASADQAGRRSSGSSDLSSSTSEVDDEDDDDDDDDDVRRSSVQPERLLDEDAGESAQTTAAKNNPFLAQSEETDHLLAGEQTSDLLAAQAPVAELAPVTPALAQPKLPPRASELIKVSKTRDIKLIKGLALKAEHNPVLRLIPRLKAKFPGLLLICDTCLCAFTSTGHCCLFEDHTRAGPDGAHHSPISNKLTCQYLAMLALEYAKRGCDVIAPSDMMDNRILHIREKLNERGLHHVSILSYSAKFASAFYGPFRQATINAPQFGDRRSYQLPPGSRALAFKAVQRDIDQGADFVMVKPGGAYLDIVRDICNTHPQVPVAVYQVSGEYSILKMAAKMGLVNLGQAVNESLTAFRRAGATIIITYFAPELLRGDFDE